MKVRVITTYSDGKAVCQVEISAEEQTEIVRVQGSEKHDQIGRGMSLGICNAIEAYSRQEKALEAVKEQEINILA